MAKTSRNLVNGSGTVSTTLSSDNLTFSQSQDLLWGAAVVLSDGQQFTIRDGAGTAWAADQRATATASGKTFQTSDGSSSRARGSGPIIVKGLHYLYVAPVDDQGSADAYAYYDTLVPNENNRHPYTRDEYSGKKFYQEEPPGDFMVPPRVRWWDDFSQRALLLQCDQTGSYSWTETLMVDATAGKARYIATGGTTSWSPLGGVTVSVPGAPVFFNGCGLGRRPIVQLRWACLVGGSVYQPPTRRLGLMTNPTPGLYDADPSDGAFFRHTTTGTIKAVARKSGTETVLDTGVSVADGVYHHGMLISRLGGTAVEVWIDAVTKGVLTTNLPLPATNLSCLLNLGPGNFATEGFDIDYYYVEMDRPS